MSSEKVRPGRGKNFLEEEKILVIDLASKFKDVIENKRTDGVSNKEKEKAWNAITEEYNRVARTGPRTMKSIHGLYDALRLSVSKKFKASSYVECYDQHVNSGLKFSGAEARLLRMMDNPAEQNQFETVYCKDESLSFTDGNSEAVADDSDIEPLEPKIQISSCIYPEPKSPPRFPAPVIQVSPSEPMRQAESRLHPCEEIPVPSTPSTHDERRGVEAGPWCPDTSRLQSGEQPPGRPVQEPVQNWQQSRKRPSCENMHEMFSTLMGEQSGLAKLREKILLEEAERAREKHEAEMTLLKLSIEVMKQKLKRENGD